MRTSKSANLLVLFYSVIRAVIAIQFLGASSLLLDGLSLLLKGPIKLQGSGKAEVMISLGLFIITCWESKIVTAQKKRLVKKAADQFLKSTRRPDL